jgi:hypothetical protein
LGVFWRKLADVQVFACGDEAAVRRSLRAFIDEMDRSGHGYRLPGDEAAWEPHTLSRSGGMIFATDDPQVVLVLSGSAWFSGRDERVHVGPGKGIYWKAGESWQVDIEVDPLVYLAVDGAALRMDHFSVELRP